MFLGHRLWLLCGLHFCLWLLNFIVHEIVYFWRFRDPPCRQRNLSKLKGDRQLFMDFVCRIGMFLFPYGGKTQTLLRFLWVVFVLVLPMAGKIMKTRPDHIYICNLAAVHASDLVCGGYFVVIPSIYGFRGIYVPRKSF